MLFVLLDLFKYTIPKAPFSKLALFLQKDKKYHFIYPIIQKNTLTTSITDYFSSI
ncbi:hypothetical protein AsAng_0048120 [Aureispira anguillae]|uniref:Uncharacterized protein n=1 Tax=Aureispira anguillae TaxID=2864201 RepID=A0A916DUD4_9BACT|nr:hypothetical protein AsAng_0048120 [Aureispira anguillae]